MDHSSHRWRPVGSGMFCCAKAFKPEPFTDWRNVRVCCLFERLLNDLFVWKILTPFEVFDIIVLNKGVIVMITTEKEAVFHIYHTEEQYDRGEFSKSALEAKLEYFVFVLSGFNPSKAEEERSRLNRKYGFSL